MLLLVRPLNQAIQQAAQLAASGIAAQPFCVQDTAPDHAALAELPALAAKADWLIFVSPSCIDLAWPVLSAQPPAAKLACVGRASADKLAAVSGRDVMYPPYGNDSDALLALPELQNLAGQQILIVRGDGGRAQLGETLARRGADVRYAEVYRRIEITPDWTQFDALMASATQPSWLITSSHGAETLFRQAGEARRPLLRDGHFIALHARIADSLRQLGARRVDIAANDGALLRRLQED